MTGNLYVDALAYAGFGVYAFIFVGLPGWSLLDRLRPAKGEHGRPSGDAAPAPALLEPAPAAEPEKRRSPFAPRQKEGAK